MGGLIAAAYAAGLTPAQMEQEALSLQPRRLLDLSLPHMGLLEGKRIYDYLYRILGDKDFSQCRIPVRLIAVDIETGEELALGEGRLVDAIRATISVPGIFCPARWQGRYLVDGGVTNSVPADVVRRMGAEVVIAVDVGSAELLPFSLEEASRRPISLPGLARLNPLFGTIVRSVQIMEGRLLRYRLAEAHPEVLIRPEMGPIKVEDFWRVAEVIPAGERAAEEALPAIRRHLRKRLFWR